MLRDILESIGNTPLLHVLKNSEYRSNIFLKLESFNPGGSIKDRIALRMIEQCEISGKISPGMELVEATSGNTGVGIAWIGKHKGYSVTIITPDKISCEKLALIKHLGANVIVTDSKAKPGTKEHCLEVAKCYAASPGRYYLDQFSSPYNVEAHYFTTAPEIYQQTQGNIDAVVCGIGSGGTAMGLSRYFREHAPDVKIIAVDPRGSIFYSNKYGGGFKPSAWKIEGIGSDYIPTIYDKNCIDEIHPISDEDAIEACHDLFNSDAVDLGLSSGAIVALAQKIRESERYKNIVCISPDAGERYISKLDIKS
ncbi:TPA: cysteine synthase family protein [Klebsiella michiganensis]|nr:cysteine synthase family protein [Klebsiella michiganensis]